MPKPNTAADEVAREKLYAKLKTDERADTYVIPERVMDIFVEAITDAELYGRLHQVIELFQQGTISAKDYSLLHESIANRLQANAGGGERNDN